jgi:hypothetical protein
MLATYKEVSIASIGKLIAHEMEGSRNQQYPWFVNKQRLPFDIIEAGRPRSDDYTISRRQRQICSRIRFTFDDAPSSRDLDGHLLHN